MKNAEEYVMLLSSLPRPGPLFVERQTPLSRPRLEARLRLLSDEHALVLHAVEDALEWRNISGNSSGQDVFNKARYALSLMSSETLQTIIQRRLELRTCIAALRGRYQGEGAPAPEKMFGFGRWRGQVQRNWSSTGFGLDTVFPWIKDADRLIKTDDALGLERLILEAAYTDLSRYSGLHIFDFEAVIIYVLKWSIIDRWGRYNAEAASHRFTQLIADGLKSYPENSRIGAN